MNLKNYTVNISVKQLLLILVAIAIPYAVYGAVTVHKHAHSPHNNSGERLEDGSFKPRDADHHGADGEHFAEFDHEAIIGSVKEAEEYHQLSADESKERLRILVGTRIDTNKDQFVDKHELKAHILRSFKLVCTLCHCLQCFSIHSLYFILVTGHCLRKKQTIDSTKSMKTMTIL